MPPIAGKRVLVFGDSLSHPGSDSGPEQHDYTGPVTSSAPGAVLAGKLLGEGASATRTNARVGRSAINFWSREDYKTLLANDIAWRPDIVIVMLGTNDLGHNLKTDAGAMAGIRDVFRQNGAEVIAIGPPAFASADLGAKTNDVVAMMRDVFGKDKFLDARGLSLDITDVGRAGDGVHFTPQGAELFGLRLTRAVSTSSTGAQPQVAIALGLAIGLAAFLAVQWLHR